MIVMNENTDTGLGATKMAVERLDAELRSSSSQQLGSPSGIMSVISGIHFTGIVFLLVWSCCRCPAATLRNNVLQAVILFLLFNLTNVAESVFAIKMARERRTIAFALGKHILALLLPAALVAGAVFIPPPVNQWLLAGFLGVILLSILWPKVKVQMQNLPAAVFPEQEALWVRQLLCWLAV